MVSRRQRTTVQGCAACRKQHRLVWRRTQYAKERLRKGAGNGVSGGSITYTLLHDPCDVPLAQGMQISTTEMAYMMRLRTIDEGARFLRSSDSEEYVVAEFDNRLVLENDENRLLPVSYYMEKIEIRPESDS